MASLDSLPQWVAHHAGDQCLVLEFGNSIDRKLVDQVVSLNTAIQLALDNGQIQGIRETVPTFRSLALIYDPYITSPEELLASLTKLLKPDHSSKPTESSLKEFCLPVHYGGDSGPDLQEVAELTKLTTEEVISLHTSTTFLVYMLGFLPGFAFLGDTPKALHLPRRLEPRVRVPAGSVAIALSLTGVYPWDSPGGWHILGQCPVTLFDSSNNPPTLFKAGDRVRFRSISDEELVEIKYQLDQGVFDTARLEPGNTSKG